MKKFAIMKNKFRFNHLTEKEGLLCGKILKLCSLECWQSFYLP
jgi:hypothetical protein